MIVISHSIDVLAGSFHYPVHIGCVCIYSMLYWIGITSRRVCNSLGDGGRLEGYSAG